MKLLILTINKFQLFTNSTKNELFMNFLHHLLNFFLQAQDYYKLSYLISNSNLVKKNKTNIWYGASVIFLKKMVDDRNGKNIKSGTKIIIIKVTI